MQVTPSAGEVQLRGEAVAAAHNLDECYPTLIALHELKARALAPRQLRDMREVGCLAINVSLTIDAES
eukprot:4078630-Pyramimonas_sp.AAC.1